MNQTLIIPIQNESDVILARLQVRDLARSAGLHLGDQARISLAASALAHALELGKTYQGQMVLDCVYDGERTGVRVVCTEKDGAQRDVAPGALGEAKWMVDVLTIETLPPNDLRATLIKWQSVNEMMPQTARKGRQ